MIRSFERWGVPLAGVAAVAFLFGKNFLEPADMPDANAPAGQIIKFVSANSSAFALDPWLDMTGVVLFAIFFVALLHRSGIASGMSAAMVWIGLILDICGSLIGDMLVRGVSDLQGDAQFSVGLFRLIETVDRFFALGNAVLFIGVAFLVVQSRMLPRGFGYVAAALGLASAVSIPVSLVSSAGGGIADAVFPLTALWMLSASGLLAWRAARTRVTGQRAVSAMPSGA